VQSGKNRKSVKKRFGSFSFAAEPLEDRRLLSATLSVSESLMVFNAVQNSSPSQVETLTLTNSGDAALTLNGVSVAADPSQTGNGSARFSVVNAANLPSSLAVGASFALQVDYSAIAKGLDYALLDISSSDPNNGTEQVQLHGIGTTGVGGGNQPSLERILQAYSQPNYANVGESDPTSAYYPEPPAAGSDEVALQELVKAGPGPVTINVLASFTGASTEPYTLGWYNTAAPSNSQQELFYTPTSESQSVYVQPQGLTSFDPGSTVFGFYNPSATVSYNNVLVTGHTQDDLNTDISGDLRKFRFFPYEPNGTPVANTYIMTSTEYYSSAGYDFTNIVAIVSNVTAAPGAPAGPVLSVTNPDALAGSNTLIFNRIQSPNASTGDVVHDTNTITLENTGAGSLTIDNVTVTATTAAKNGGTQYQLVNPPTFPVTLSAGQTQTIQVQFVLSQVDANGHSSNETNSDGNGGGGSVYPGILTITSNDANAATTTLPMEAWWQEHSENENEPDLQTMVNLMAGYGTDINPSATNFLTESTSATAAPTYYGEEVVSAYWTAADSTHSVAVQQIAAYHTEGTTSGLNYFSQGSSSTHSVLSTAADDGQTFFPLNTAGNAATGSISVTGNFGFEVLNPNTWSDDTKNVNDASKGHLIRFYPVRDSSGNLVPNTYILACDYPNGTSENFDFQDDVYLIRNMRPVSTTAVSSPQSTGGAAAPAAISALNTSSGVSLQWVPVLDSTVIGYDVYSSLSAGNGYALLNSTPVTGNTYLDTTAPAGETVYYRVSAVNSTGVGLGPQTSVSTGGTASNNLQSIAINETPSGSATTVTQNTAYTVIAGGPGVTGTLDGFQFLYTAETGNFDVDAQVSSITVAGNFSTAGIMARDGLSDTGSNVYMSASPANYRFKYRTTDGGTEAVTAGTAAPDYPDAWVRLTRVGNVFTGYTSPDGVVWTQLGQETLGSFPATAFLGLAVASNTTTVTTTAQLANYGTTPSYVGPVTKPESYTAVSAISVQESPLANDEDVTGTIVPGTFTITSPPNEGGTASFNAASGLLTYTSAAGFSGTESLTYTVADSNNVVSSPTTITFNVTPSGPVSMADSFTAIAGQATQLNVLANDTDATSTLNPATVTIVTQPTSGATVTVNTTTGVITYLAPTSFSGSDTFSYTVADAAGQVSTPATVDVTVSPTTTGTLVTVPVTTTATAGIATTINVLTVDTDASAAILPGTVTIVTPPNHGGTAVANTDGTITYTPAASYGGVETFYYTVTDTAGDLSAATLVTATVSNPSAAPVAANVTTTANANGSLAFSVGFNAVTTVGLNLSSIAVAAAPAHGTTAIDTTTGVITYTPAANFVGPDTFTYTVADTNGHTSNVATVNVNVGVTVENIAGANRSLTFTSAGGLLTTISLNRGSVQVLFSSTGTLSVTRQGKATVSGSGLMITGLALTGTTSASTLSVAGRGNGALTIGGITDVSPIRTISAPKAVLTGAVSLSGISTLQVATAIDAPITVGAGAPNVTFVAGAVSDSTLTSAVPIKTISVTSWTSSTEGASAITAPSISSLIVRGNFQPTLTLSGGGTALRGASIKGTISGSWTITGNTGGITTGGVDAGFHAAVSGYLAGLNDRAGGLAAAITAGNIGTLSVTGGLSGAISTASARTVRVVGNVTAGAALDFTGAGTSLNTLSVTGSITGATLTAAGNVGSITATSLSGDTILIGAPAGTTLANVTSSTIGSSTLSLLRLTARGTTTFADSTLIVNTLKSGALGGVVTSTADNSMDGLAVASARSITATENGTAFRFTAASTTSVIFGDFEIKLV
jgi:hypothetical protein